jgi:molybdopterin/thiamine biosynthesis adenylyltransferase
MGIESVAKQSQASVFLYGLSPLGVEVAKNLVLSGLKRLTIADVKRESYSLAGQFYMKNPANRLK